MVKFTKGMWTLTEDTAITWAVEAVKTEVRGNSIHCVAVRFSLPPQCNRLANGVD